MVGHVPAWVFAVFALLLSLGVWLSRPRAVSPAAPVLLAVVFPAYSLYGVVASFGASAVAVLAWAVGLLLSVVPGRRVFGPANLSLVGGSTKVQIPGSWLPLVLMMGIFLIKFAVGFVQGTQLAVGGETWFAPATCLALGAFSGGFVARAVTIRRFVRRATGDA